MFKQSTCLQKEIEHGGWGGFVYFTWPTVISLKESAQHTRTSLIVCSSGVDFSNVGAIVGSLCRVRLEKKVFRESPPVAIEKHKDGYKPLKRQLLCSNLVQMRRLLPVLSSCHAYLFKPWRLKKKKTENGSKTR